MQKLAKSEVPPTKHTVYFLFQQDIMKITSFVCYIVNKMGVFSP